VIEKGTDFLKDHWAIATATVVMFVTLVGYFQQYYLFISFGVNIANFSSFEDFFLAFFRRDVLVGALILTLVLIVSFILFRVRLKKTEITRKLNKTIVFSIVFYVVGMIIYAAGTTADQIKQIKTEKYFYSIVETKAGFLMLVFEALLLNIHIH